MVAQNQEPGSRDVDHQPPGVVAMAASGRHFRFWGAWSCGEGLGFQGFGLQGFRVSGFQGFRVSGFRVLGFGV